jgi:wobble nucleotide-excising tRNase
MRLNYDQTISVYLRERTDFCSKSKQIVEEVTNIEQEIKPKRELITEEQRKTINIEEAIKNINNSLSEFGIDGFTIEKHSDGLYQIKRREQTTEPCSKTFYSLSEGEKMIISFLYFCELCEGKKSVTSQTNKKIVIIDDPISSLSHIFVFNVGQLIKEKFFKSNNYEQVFILTHNLYFFYELTNAMQIKKQEKGYKNLNLFRITKNSNGSKISLMKYNEVKNDYQSYWSIINNDKSAQQHPALIAICMRNVIEYFFGFVKNIELDDIFKKEHFQNTKYQSFIRYMHRKSHSTGRNLFDDSDYYDFKEPFKLVFTESGYKEHFETMSEIE